MIFAMSLSSVFWVCECIGRWKRKGKRYRYIHKYIYKYIDTYYIGAVVTTNNSPIVSRLLLDFSMMKKSLYLEGKNSEKLFSMPAPPPLPLHGSGWFNPNILSFDYNYLSIQAKKLHKHSIR